MIAIWAQLLVAALSRQEADPFEQQVRPFLAKHCLECHGTEKPKGDFRIDRLSSDFAGDAVRERWLAVQERIASGAMPPKKQPRPPAKEIESVSAWITGRVTAA